MNKNIVIFGCDNAGKTTLAEQIIDMLNQWGYKAKYRHSPGKDAPIGVMFDFMESNLTEDCITIFDRFPVIEEEVCGRVLRGKNIFDGYVGETDAMLSKVDLFVFCMPHIFDIINWGEREQMDGVKDSVLELIHGYEELAVKFKILGYNITQYSWRDELGTQGEFNKRIKEVLE